MEITKMPTKTIKTKNKTEKILRKSLRIQNKKRYIWKTEDKETKNATPSSKYLPGAPRT